MRLVARDLSGSVVVITGASSGLGRATALAFAEHGTRLVLAARGEEALRSAAEECEALGADTLVVPVDMADAAGVERLRRQSLERFERIDVWVEAAGALVAAPFGEETVDELERVVDTNVIGTFLGSRAALRTFESQGRGVLVNTGSLLGLVPNPMVPAYTMTKLAVRGLTLSLRQAFIGHPGIDVCVVLPGPIDTPLFQRAANRTGRQLRSIPPAYAPERVAATVVACARRPRRQATTGVLGHLILTGHRVVPRLVEWGVAQYSARAVTRRDREPAGEGALFQPAAVGQVHGGWRSGEGRRHLGERLGRWASRRGASADSG